MMERSQKRGVLLLGVVAALAAIIAAGGLSRFGGASDAPIELTGPGTAALPGLVAKVDELTGVRVTLADMSYTFRRTEMGWALAESGNYPISDSRVTALISDLAELKHVAVKTRDPAKLERLGLGDPRAGGNGALVQLYSAGDAIEGALIIGRREDRLYAREQDALQSWQVDGHLPALHTRRAWLDLDFIDMDEDAVAAVRLEEVGGASLSLIRETGEDARDFLPGPPYEREQLLNRVVAIGPALALTRFSPVNVRRAGTLQSAPLMRHTTITHDGLEITVDAYREADGVFVTLRAIEAGEGAARANSINQRAEGWAFELSRFDWNDFATPIGDIVERPSLAHEQ